MVDHNTNQQQSTSSTKEEEKISSSLNDVENICKFDLIKMEVISKFGKFEIVGNGNNKLNNPHDIIYNNNLIYIADYGNYRVVILDNLLKYKNEIELKSHPFSLAINNNYLFIGCNDTIYKYNLNTLQLINEINSNENYTFNCIYGMTCDKDNNLYICNFGGSEIIILNENNEFIRKFKINYLIEPNRIIINNKDQIVITCHGDIQVFDKFGNFILNVKLRDSNLCGIICDKNDNYLICDWDSSALLLLDNNFKLKKEIKALDYENMLLGPNAVTLNEENNEIYVCDCNGSCCKLFK